jgi:type II secretory pathway pseudopilin PulG
VKPIDSILAVRLPHSGSGGFVMLSLLMAIATVSILSTRIMLNSVSEVQREQEAELIFRGEAIAKAIFLYKRITGSYPSNLRDLTNVRPRIIRKLYKDPMTMLDSRYKGDWDLVFYDQHEVPEDFKSINKSSMSVVGVRSFCKSDSKKIYQGKDLVSDWIFIGINASDASKILSTR